MESLREYAEHQRDRAGKEVGRLPFNPTPNHPSCRPWMEALSTYSLWNIFPLNGGPISVFRKVLEEELEEPIDPLDPPGMRQVRDKVIKRILHVLDCYEAGLCVT